MIVYHGTAHYDLHTLQCPSRIELRPRMYLGGRPAFCTTTDLDIAILFALRRSPPGLLRGDTSEAGGVLEYELADWAEEGHDWVHAVCRGVLQDEKEVAILNRHALLFQSVIRLDRTNWIRSLVQ